MIYQMYLKKKRRLWLSSRSLWGEKQGLAYQHLQCFNYRDSLAIESTTISPIPRPVSSLNMAALAAQSSFPVSLDPPPVSRNVSRTQSAPLKLSAIQQLPTSTTTETKSSRSHQFLFKTIYSFFLVSEKLLETCGSFDEAEVPPVIAIKRALSCDSVCSDTSVALGDLEVFNVTGYLCIGLEYDRWVFLFQLIYNQIGFF